MRWWRGLRITRPSVFWGPYRKRLSAEDQAALKIEHRNDILACPFALVWQVTMFILPMQAVIGAWNAFYPTLVLCLGCALGMYFYLVPVPAESNYFEPCEEAGVKMGHETE